MNTRQRKKRNNLKAPIGLLQLKEFVEPDERHRIAKALEMLGGPFIIVPYEMNFIPLKRKRFKILSLRKIKSL